MKHIWEVNGGSNGKSSVITGRSGGEERRNTTRVRDPPPERQVWAELVDDVEAEIPQPLISRNVTLGSTVCSDIWKAYTDIASVSSIVR